MQPERNATIVTKKAGHVIPVALFSAILRSGINAAGFAIQDKDKNGKTVLETEHFNVAPSEAEFLEMMAACKDLPAVFYFGKFPKGFHEEDVQPFVLQMGDEKSQQSILAMFLEGDFPGYVQKNGRSDESNLHDEILLPTMHQYLEMTVDKEGNPDLGKFFKSLGADSFQKTLLNTASHRGAFSFVPADGDIVVFNKDNKLGEEFDWGYTSQTHGYSEKVQETPAPVAEEKPKGKFSLFGRGKQVTAAAPAPEPAKAETKENPPGVHNVSDLKSSVPSVPPKADTALTKTGGHFEEMPLNIKNAGHKEKKKWIRKILNLGNQAALPEGWASTTSFWVPDVPGTSAPVKEMKDLGRAMASAPASGKDIKNQRASEANLMGLTEEQRSKAETSVLKYLDYKSGEMMNPTEIQKIEAKYPKVTEKLGIQLQDICTWRTEDLISFSEEHSKAAGLLLVELRRAWADAAKINIGVGSYPEQKAEEQKPEPAKAEAAAPAKKPFSLFRKSA